MTDAKQLEYDGIRIEIVTLTPELAHEWLGQNMNNRRPSKDSVGQYARDIAAGAWPFTGDPIRFDSKGRMIDGQHRALAVIAADRPIDVLVIWELSPEVQNVIDAGRKRSAADMLTLNGAPNPAGLAALARQAIGWERGKILTTRSVAPMVTHSEVIDVLARNSSLVDAAKTAAEVRKNTLITSWAGIGLAAWLIGDDLDGIEVLNDLMAHSTIGDNDPVRSLIRFFEVSVVQHRRVTAVATAFAILRTYRARAEGEQLTKIVLEGKSGALAFPIQPAEKDLP